MRQRGNLLTRIWRTTAFVAVMAVVMVLMMLWQLGLAVWWAFGDREKKRRQLHGVIHRSARRILRVLPGVRWRITGADASLTITDPCIVISNHQSHLDLLCLLALSPDIVFMAKKWVWRNPLYCLIVKYMGCVSSEDDVETNLRQIDHLRRQGYSTAIFPEGTRSADCRVGRFHQGAFYIAHRLDMDILPVTLMGTGQVMNKRAYSITPGDIEIAVGERVTGTAEADPKELRRRMQRQYRERVDRFQQNHQP